MNDTSSIWPIGLLLGATATLAVGAWALSKAAQPESNEAMVKRIMAQAGQRGPAFKDVNWDAFATVDPRYVDHKMLGGYDAPWGEMGVYEEIGMYGQPMTERGVEFNSQFRERYGVDFW